jgi:DUF1680 family protein
VGNVEINGIPLTIKQKTNYPWDGSIEIDFKAEEMVNTTLCFRIPDWCEEYSYQFSGSVNSPVHIKNGYVCLNIEIDREAQLKIDFAMPVIKAHMDPRVLEDAGKTAIQRGPVVYAFEKNDNPEGVQDILVTRYTRFNTDWEPETLGGIMKLRMKTRGREWTGIPYYAWDNRDLGEMKVFVDEETDNARTNTI